ncbi:hypothetical protein COY52_10800 [Candidatus Desantisbacteria bacterium CG_4_10_14_0_8_um_filter_48_22]|uniref:Phage-Barnase-EndoU-ColicinE5/D-RelE like nuclease 2 domain-containing protein n=1 Tax=Candidatus Desantisbacteria bacterium CG_4_10_14_0_8_um_filter_48_22 TaxID=1974543 RepID=A0A2M7S6A7_9BACT|nr:MAG: hypothetical protein COS16_11370 [Candidatus Desantisbacteria bacterium CG02_land_8_20_14_3_00_49_13]PIZ14883.1 MAG: hypothetical protein COY52_10800 [Candidatus Desantisbacteria bacterium CG_4_10_14_0_8_um_filter_48_22]PJB28063.1 MAG: hypothetical protein CO111_02465 [Candidatus Desantisbacteria bacterium CG_4_9_14_3_um_filter_50_7]
MPKFVDCFKNEITLSQQRWIHIIQEHPEVKEYIKEIETVLKDPDLIKESKKDREVYLYYRFFKEILKGKYIIVVVKKIMLSFVVTCYITDRIKEGDIIWEKK